MVWLEVPFSALPGERAKIDTKLPNGKNYGFQMNVMHIVANKAWAAANPAAAKLFAVMRLSSNDISAQNMRMKQGENSPADIDRHAEGWLKAHAKQVDAWLAEARQAAE